MRQLVRFLAITGLAEVLPHFFHKGNFGIEQPIKIHFFVEIEIVVETDRGQRKSWMLSARHGGPPLRGRLSCNQAGCRRQVGQ